MGFRSCRLPARKPSKTLQTFQTPSPAGTPGPRPLPEQAPQGQGHSNGFLWAFKAAVCQPANPPKPSKHRPQQAPQGQGHFPNRHPRAKATAMAFYGLSKLPFASPQTLQTFQNLPNPPNPPKPSKPSKHRPQQAPQGQGHFPNRHPRAKATAMAFYGLSKLPFASPQTLQNPPNPPNHPRAKATAMALYGLSKLPLASPQTLQTPPKFQTPSLTTPGPRPLPEQAPQGQGHSNGFLWAFKAAVCQPANAPNPSKIPNTFPNRHPRAKATSRTGAPGPRPQQWLSIGFQSCRLPARKRSKPSKPSKTFQTLQTPSPAGTPGPRPFQTLQTPSPAGTPGPRPLPEQAPQGQGHSDGFLWAFEAAVCQPANPPKPSKPSKHRPQQAPQGQGHFPNRHPRAKDTAMAFYGLSKLPFASPQTLQNPPNTVPSRHPRAKATSRTGTPGPRPQQWLSMGFQSCRLPARKRSSKTLQTLQTLQNLPNPPNTVPSRHPRAKATAMAFYGLSKLPFASPQTLQNPPNPPNHPRAKATAMALYGLSKLPLASPQTLQTPPKFQTPSLTGTPGPRPLPEQAPQGQGHSNGFLWAFKAAVCQPANPPKPSKHRPQQAPQGQGHFPNRHPRAKATAMAFYGLSKLPFASPQTLQTFQNLPNPPNTVPSRHPRAKATSRTGTPGPRPQQWLSMGFQSCRLPARKQQAPQGQGHFPNRHATAMAFYGLSKLPFASPQNPPKPSKPSKPPQGQGHSNGFLWAFKAAVCQPANAPNPSKIPNTFPNRHPRAKATSRTGAPGPRPQQWLSIGFQSCRLPARKPSKPSKTLQTLQTPSPAGTPGPRPLPEQAPQGQGHSNGFL